MESLPAVEEPDWHGVPVGGVSRPTRDTATNQSLSNSAPSQTTHLKHGGALKEIETF